MTKHVLIGIVLASTLAALAASPLATAGGEIHLTPGDQKWVQPFGPQGPGFSFVTGKFNDKNPASFFLKLKAGGDSGWHIHDEDYSAVVIAGAFTEQQAADKAEFVLPVGTYFTQPAKIVHRNGCRAGADCIIFVRCDHGVDATPMTRDGKPVPMPATK